MDRINWIIISFILGNFIIWGISGIEEPKDDLAKLKVEIDTLEMELPELLKTAEWLKRSQTALNEVPAENAKSFVNRVQSLAKVWKFSLQETVQNGESPVHVSFTGVGNYKATSDILREIGKNAAVVVDKISILVQDDRLLNAHFEMIVRTSEWKGNNSSKDRIEPISQGSGQLNLGNVDLFGRENLPEKPVNGTPKIRYLGFYSGKGLPTGIIEENLKAMLVRPGDRTPTGLRVESITPDTLEIRTEDKRGERWKIPLEKSH